MSPLSRRSFLRGAAAAGGAAVLGGPSLLRRVGASTHPIDHVVVLCMENRSFDHVFGSLRLVEGRTDVNGLTGAESNSWSSGETVPVFRLSGTTCNRLDPPHEWESVRLQHAAGTNDGYLRAVEEHYPETTDPARRPADAADVMGYYVRSDLPFAYGAADEFAICQNYRSPISGPTLPNRHYLHAATSGGMWDNYLDSRDRSATPSPQGDPTYGFEFRTIYEEMSAKGVDWRVYFTEAPFTMLYRWPRLNHPERFAPFSQFLADAARGDLASFTTIDPGYFTASDHAPQNVQLGQLFIASVYAALATSPAWERTALFVTYDEDGGFYDHAGHAFLPDERGSRRSDGGNIVERSSFTPSPTPAYLAHPEEPLNGDFSLSGGRLPTMVLGPHVRAGYVSDTLADHTSILAFVEERFGLDALTERDAHHRAAGSTLADCFDLGTTRSPAVLPVPSFHVSMFSDCGSTYVAPPAPYVPGPRDPSNPSLDLNHVLAVAIGAGAIPSVAPDEVRRTYVRAFDLAARLGELV